jgi:hypothetical protein
MATQRTYLVSPTFATKLANGSDGLTPSDKWPDRCSSCREAHRQALTKRCALTREDHTSLNVTVHSQRRRVLLNEVKHFINIAMQVATKMPGSTTLDRFVGAALATCQSR